MEESCPLRSPTPIEALSVRSSSPATSTPSLEQQKSGEIHEEKAAGEVLGDAHASDDLLEVSHVTGEVCGKPEPPYSEVDGDFWQKKSRKKIWRWRRFWVSTCGFLCQYSESIKRASANQYMIQVGYQWARWMGSCIQFLRMVISESCFKEQHLTQSSSPRLLRVFSVHQPDHSEGKVKPNYR